MDSITKRFVLIAVFLTLLAGQVAALTKCPTGFYTLTDSSIDPLVIDPTKPTGDPLIDRDYFDGYRLRPFWTHIQPDTTGIPATDSTSYNWNVIDSQIAIVAAHGKKLGISISMNRNAPRWTYALGAYKFLIDPDDNSLNDALFDMPLPWETVYQAQLFAFIDALAAKYNNNPTITYIAMTGYQQRVEGRLINNIDASVTFTDADITNVTVGPTTFAKIHSGTANFTTATGKKPLIGTIIFDNVFDNSATPDVRYLRSNSAVCGIAEGCPADPTNTDVYLNKSAFLTGTGKKAHLQNWTIGLGDEYKANQHAISFGNCGGPGTGCSDVPPACSVQEFGRTWTPCSPSVTTGFASTRAYMKATIDIMAKWREAFSNTPVYITGGTAMADSNPWSQQAAVALKDHHQTEPNGGYMVASMYAICAEDYTNVRPDILTPKGDQAIYSLGNPQSYQNGTCQDGSAIPVSMADRVRDQIQAAYERGDWSFETYFGEISSTDPLIQAAWREKRGLFASHCESGGEQGPGGGKTPQSARKGIMIVR